MVNLLPHYWQKKIKEEEILKAVSIIGIVVALATVSFALMLLSVKFYYSAGAEALKIEVDEKEREIAIFKIASEERKMADIGSSISIIGDFYNRQTRITGLLAEISELTPAAVNLESFSYQPGSVEIKGFAVDRDALLLFKNNLENRPDFENVVFPQDSWLKAKDIEFNATIGLLAKP